MNIVNDYDYDEVATIRLEIPFLEVNTIFPVDFRSKREIMA